MQYCAPEMQDNNTTVTIKIMIIVVIHGGILLWPRLHFKRQPDYITPCSDYLLYQLSFPTVIANIVVRILQILKS